MVGWADLPADLSDDAALARIRAHLPADALIVSSDLSRAVDTATAIQGARRRLPHRPKLREINFGTWELKPHAEIEAEDPELAFAYWDQPGEVRPPEGESWNEVCARVDTEVDSLLAEHAGDDLIIVAHFGVILTQIQRALKIEPQEAFGHRIDNLSITEILVEPDIWSVHRINHIP